jgi:hypothetical protein
MLPKKRVVLFKHGVDYFQEKLRREVAGLGEKLERWRDVLDDMVEELDIRV